MDRTQEINEYVRRMYSYAIKNGVTNRCFYKYGRRHPEFDDAFQIVVGKVYEHLVKNPELKFNSDGHLATYLFHAVTNHLVDISRTTKYRNTAFIEDFNGEQTDVTNWMDGLSEGPFEMSIEEDEDAAVMRQRLDAAMSKLRPELATSLRLLAEGRSYKEGAEHMQVTLSTFKQYVFRARIQVKQLLGGRW